MFDEITITASKDDLPNRRGRGPREIPPALLAAVKKSVKESCRIDVTVAKKSANTFKSYVKTAVEAEYGEEYKANFSVTPVDDNTSTVHFRVRPVIG